MRLSRRCRSSGQTPEGKTTRRGFWKAALAIATAFSLGALGTYVVLRRLAPAANGGSADGPRAAEVEKLIRRYFRTWSAQDLEGYGECFWEDSSAQFIDAGGKIVHFTRPEFLASQREFLRSGPRATEVPESIDIRFESELARVVVYWKLTVGPQEVFGYDHFTLLERDGKWGIVNLVWHETKHPG